MTDNTVPLKYQALFQRVKQQKYKPKAEAIKAFCLECVGFKFKRVANCTAPTCALFNVRPYQDKGSKGVEGASERNIAELMPSEPSAEKAPVSCFPRNTEMQLDTSSLEYIWIGSTYSQNRIFVLGESWYGDYADNTDVGYVTNYLNGQQIDRMYTRMANACKLSRTDFWHQIIFTNFVQKVGQTRKDRPTKIQYLEARSRLEELLRLHKPRGVWVLGKEQSEYSSPVIAKAGIPYEVSAHPTSFGLTNEALGNSWNALLRISASRE